jgi:hypothetical protein
VNIEEKFKQRKEAKKKYIKMMLDRMTYSELDCVIVLIDNFTIPWKDSDPSLRIEVDIKIDPKKS